MIVPVDMCETYLLFSNISIGDLLGCLDNSQITKPIGSSFDEIKLARLGSSAGHLVDYHSG